MTESSGKVVEFPSESSQDVLTAIRRDGARQLLARAIVEEVAEYVDTRKPCQDEHGRQLVVRNGHLPPRTIQTPLGEIPAQAAAGARPAVRGRPREVHVVNSAAVPAEDELVGRAVSLALPQGHQHRGFQRGVAGSVGTRRARSHTTSGDSSPFKAQWRLAFDALHLQASQKPHRRPPSR